MTSEVVRRFHEAIRDAAQRLGYFPSREDHVLVANLETVNNLRQSTALGGIVDISNPQNDLTFMGVPVQCDPSVSTGDVRLVGVDRGSTNPEEVVGIQVEYDMARMVYVCLVTFADGAEVHIEIPREYIENTRGVPAGLDARDRANWAQAMAVNEARMQRRRAMHGGLTPTVPIYGTQPGKVRLSANSVKAAQPEPFPPPSDSRVMEVPTNDLPVHPVRKKRGPRLIGEWKYHDW